MIAFPIFRKVKGFILLCILAAGLSGCQRFEMPAMPAMPEIPRLSSLFSRNDAPPPAARPADDISQTPAPGPSVPPLRCRISEGEALFTGRWHEYKPLTLEIHKNRQAYFDLTRPRRHDRAPLLARYDESGQKIVFCPMNTPMNTSARNGDVTCTSLYALEDDFIIGIRRTFDIENLLRGATIECRTAPPQNLWPAARGAGTR